MPTRQRLDIGGGVRVTTGGLQTESGLGLRLGVSGLARVEFWRGLGLLRDGAGPERTGT